MKEREGEKGNGEISKELTTTLRIAGKMGVPAPLERWSFLQGPRFMVYGLLDAEVTERFRTPLFQCCGSMQN